MDEVGPYSYLRWICVDPSNLRRNLTVFLVFGLFFPWLSYYYVSVKSQPSRQFQATIEISLSALATLSFVWLSLLLRYRGVEKVFLLDNLLHEPYRLRRQQFLGFSQSLEMLSRLGIVLPYIVCECALKVSMYTRGSSEKPFLGNMVILSNIVASSLELTSWLYRITIFLSACTVFSHAYDVQKLRLVEFNKFFKANSDLKLMLNDYLRICDDMSSINNDFSPFLTILLVIITVFIACGLLFTIQLESLSMTIAFMNADFEVYSMLVLLGLGRMNYSLTDMLIMMKGITSSASRWHATQSISIADGSTSFQERQVLVNCFVQSPCDVAIGGVKVEAVWPFSVTFWIIFFIANMWVVKYLFW